MVRKGHLVSIIKTNEKSEYSKMKNLILLFIELVLSYGTHHRVDPSCPDATYVKAYSQVLKPQKKTLFY